MTDNTTMSQMDSIGVPGTGIPVGIPSQYMPPELNDLPEAVDFTKEANDNMERFSEQIGEDAVYLNWSLAWRIFKEKYPKGTFRYMTDRNGNPYIYDQMLGYRVGIHLSLDGKTYMPVIQRGVYYGTDVSDRQSMKAEPFTYKDKFGNDIICPAATYADIEKAQMRCIARAIAIHTGIGLSFYTKNQKAKVMTTKDLETASGDRVDELRSTLKELGFNVMEVLSQLPNDFGKRPATLDGVNNRQFDWIATTCLTKYQSMKYLNELEARLKAVKADIPMLLNSIPESEGGPVKAISEVESKAQFKYLRARCRQLEADFAAANNPPRPTGSKARGTKASKVPA